MISLISLQTDGIFLLDWIGTIKTFAHNSLKEVPGSRAQVLGVEKYRLLFSNTISQKNCLTELHRPRTISGMFDLALFFYSGLLGAIILRLCSFAKKPISAKTDEPKSESEASINCKDRFCILILILFGSR